MAAIAEQGLAQKLLRLAMDAVYHDSLTSMQKGESTDENVQSIKSRLCDFVDTVKDDMLSGELDPFTTDPGEWLLKKGFIKEKKDGL